MSTERAEGTQRVAFLDCRMASAARMRITSPLHPGQGVGGSTQPPEAAGSKSGFGWTVEQADGPLSRRTPEPHSASPSVLAPAHGFLDAVPRASIGARFWPRLGT
jgi:hypothetical protein